MSCGLVKGLIQELPLVLGSHSPRRAQILRELGLDFIVDSPDIPEERLDGEEPEDHVLRLAREKALAVAGRHSTGTVLAGDTIVLLDDCLLGKPVDSDDAVTMLKRIRGRWHEVLTGLAVVRCSDGAVAGGFERTRVLIRRLSDIEVERYVAGGEPLDKAGSYAIQECGAAVVDRVDGCFYNVVGLPVVRLCRLLEELRAGEAGA